MSERIILDTGPLVAFFRAADQHHAWTVERWRELPAPFHTCEAVIVEALHLLRQEPQAGALLLRFLKQQRIKLDFDLKSQIATVEVLMGAYKNVPMSLADACLVRMAEMIPNSSIFTLDSDFLVYRKHGKRGIPVILPSER